MAAATPAPVSETITRATLGSAATAAALADRTPVTQRTWLVVMAASAPASEANCAAVAVMGGTPVLSRLIDARRPPANRDCRKSSFAVTLPAQSEIASPVDRALITVGGRAAAVSAVIVPVATTAKGVVIRLSA